MNAPSRPVIALAALLLISAAFSAPCSAAPATPVPLLEIPVTGPSDSDRLFRMGLDIVGMRPGVWVRVLGWPADREALAAAGIAARVIEEDHGRGIALRNAAFPETPPRAFARDSAAPLSVPPPGSGSMGGYYTYAEINALIDSLAAFDTPGIVGVTDSIGASLLGRKIRAVRIADESQPDHSRPRVLFTALTHAREGIGMQTLLHFMGRLVSGYGTDPNLTYLVDHRETWFVPVVNPDGYLYNEGVYNNSGSFGLWRKNLRDNNNSGTITSADGVDLNRNFGFQWGYNNSGSSGTPSSATYRGPSAFSEPETRVLRDFCVLHDFATANNYHTYGELCLYPWSYNGADSPDSGFFIRMTDELMRDTRYAYGVVADILYPVNGDANDWMYGEQTLKPKVMVVTTEVGDQNDNFWPPPARIPVLSALQDHANEILAYSAGTFVKPDSAWISGGDGYLHPGLSANVTVRLRNAGLLDSDGGVTVSAATTAAGITVTDAACAYPPIAAGSTANPSASDVLTLAASPSVPAGTIVPIVLTITDAGDYVRVDTVDVTVGEPVVVFADDAGSGLGNWTAVGGWGIQVTGADSVFSDSPSGNYTAHTDRTLTLTAPLDLSGGLAAFLTFRHTFDIEVGYDAGFVQVSTNGGASWTSLPGRMTRPGHGTTAAYAGGKQPVGVPVYDANRKLEATERIDLTAYAGLTDLRLRFRLQSDAGTERNGWLIDDIRVLAYPMDVSAAAPGPPPAARGRVALSPAWPNPSSSGTRVTATFAAPTPFTAAVFSADGRLVRPVAQGIADGERDFFWDGSAANGRPAAAGRYYLRVRWDGGAESVALIRVR